MLEQRSLRRLVQKNKDWDIRAVTPQTLVRFASAEWASYKPGANAQPEDVDELALAGEHT